MIKRLLIPALICCNFIAVYAQTPPAKDTTEKHTPYSKLFDKKEVKSAKGVITLHNIEGKVYFELPLELIGKSFLMSSVVDNVSNMGLSYVGQRTSRPSHITFSRTDSLVQIRLMPVPKIVDSGDEGIRDAVISSSLPAVINSVPIVAHTPDSSAIVFDVTSFFVSGGRHIGTLNASSFGGFIQKVSTFSKELSTLKDVVAFSDNVSIISDMTYTFKTFFLGMESGGTEYLTVELRTTLTLLPQEQFRHRYADYRMGTAVTAFERFNSREQGSNTSYFANRWRIEPSDVDAWKRGELTEPVKPIVFYVDTLFIPSWREAVKRGLLKWNEAFEKIGFKDVIRVYDYPSPSEDPHFSSGNISYNCVKYAQIPSRNIVRQVNTDPRSGEILSASILFFRDSPVTLQRERIYQTAAVEPDVRDFVLPDHLMVQSIELAMTREMGFCLGLSANLAASSWMPTDSLRSASFTQRESITSSVMDQITYNYIAQPGDIEKGVKLTADKLGVYDYYAIDWLYKPLVSSKSPSQEVQLLREKIREKQSDRRFFYGREQSGAAYFDPRSLIEDLGDDKIKSAQYGINTLKYIANNATEWINKDEADESYRELFVDFIFLKLYDYYRSLMVNIGGIEINPKYEGDPFPAYSPVAKSIQRESLLFMLSAADNMDWVDNDRLIQMSGMNSSLSRFFSNNLVRMAYQRIPMVAFAMSKSEDPYTLDQMLKDLSGFALKSIRRGDVPTEAQKAALFSSAQVLLTGSNLPKVTEARAKNPNAFTFVEEENYLSYNSIMARCYPGEMEINLEQTGQNSISANSSFAQGFQPLVSIKYLAPQDNSAVYYKNLLDLRRDLQRGLRRAKDPKTKSLMNYLIISIDKGIGKN